MNVNLKLILCIMFGLPFCITGLRLKTRHDSLHLDWQTGPASPDQWEVVYSVMGTGYHSLFSVNGTETTATIHTTDYPGMLYRVKLYSVTNGTKSQIGVAYGRSDCSTKISFTVGETASISSNGYPAYIQPGSICSWALNGSDVTWFRLHFVDIDLNNNGSCKNHLEISDKKVCDNETTNSTIRYVTDSRLYLRQITTALGDGRGFFINVTAIHKIDQPRNITARVSGTVIKISWLEPLHHPANFTYVLRISNLQQLSTTDVHVPGTRSFYLFNYQAFAGQTFSFTVRAVTEDTQGDFSLSVDVETSCDRRVYIKPTGSRVLTSSRYPFGYLRGIRCLFTVYTNPGFILRIVTSEMDISGGAVCGQTYLEFTGIGRYCSDSPPNKEIVTSNATVRMVFLTDNTTNGKGFNLTVSSVSTPPSEPTTISSKASSTTIQISWGPPTTNQAYVSGYTVDYFLLPSTPGGTLHVGPDTRTVTLYTRGHPGRLYSVRVGAWTGGGRGPFSRPVFARAECGGSSRLTRMQTAIISTDALLADNLYQPGIMCKWDVRSDPLLWLRVDVDMVDLELSPNCSKDFLRVTDNTVVCGKMGPKTFLVKQQSIEMVFSSDFNVSGMGFRLSVTAIGPPPGVPQLVKTMPIDYSLFIAWNHPAYFRQFVTGYLVNYRFVNDAKHYTQRVNREVTMFTFDMTSFPGRLVVVWLQATGDLVDGNSSTPEIVRNECGKRYSLSDNDEPLFLASPYHNNGYTNDIFCKWTITANPTARYALRFVQLEVNNGQSCDNTLRINRNITVCNSSMEGSELTLHMVPDITVEMETIDGGILNFVLQIRRFPRTTGRSSSTHRLTSGGVSVLPTPSVAILLTAVVSTFMAPSTMGSSWENSMKHELYDSKSSQIHENISVTSIIATEEPFLYPKLDVVYTEGALITTELHTSFTPMFTKLTYLVQSTVQVLPDKKTIDVESVPTSVLSSDINHLVTDTLPKNRTESKLSVPTSALARDINQPLTYTSYENRTENQLTVPSSVISSDINQPVTYTLYENRTERQLIVPTSVLSSDINQIITDTLLENRTESQLIVPTSALARDIYQLVTDTLPENRTENQLTVPTSVFSSDTKNIGAHYTTPVRYTEFQDTSSVSSRTTESTDTVMSEIYSERTVHITASSNGVRTGQSVSSMYILLILVSYVYINPF